METGRLTPEIDDKPREKCGIVGVSGQIPDIASRTYDALYELQHRGEQAAGITILDQGTMETCKAPGKVKEVFANGNLAALPEGRIGVGHVRYQTVEIEPSQVVEAIQPLHHQEQRFVVAHNGNLTHIDDRPFRPNGKSDTAVITDLIAQALAAQSERDLPAAVVNALQRIDGAYSLVIADEENLIALRDPRGFRPLAYGQMANGAYAVASESVALDALGIDKYISLEAGQMIVINRYGAEAKSYLQQPERGAFCLMELVYFSRPDTMYGSASVHTMRVRSGERLAAEAPADVDIVIGVPGTGLDAAMGYARQLGLPYSDKGIHKTGYERSFIANNDAERREVAQRKFNVTRDVVDGKRVAVVDDSLIRGTVTSVIVEKLRAFGATEVHFRVASPPYRNSCHYGIDTGRESELIARNLSEAEIAKLIGVDSLNYLSLNGLKESMRFIEERLCDACITGNYPAPLKIGRFALNH